MDRQIPSEGNQPYCLAGLLQTFLHPGGELGSAIIKQWLPAAREAAIFCQGQHVPGKAQVVNQSISTTKHNIKKLRME